MRTTLIQIHYRTIFFVFIKYIEQKTKAPCCKIKALKWIPIIVQWKQCTNKSGGCLTPHLLILIQRNLLKNNEVKRSNSNSIISKYKDIAMKLELDLKAIIAYSKWKWKFDQYSLINCESAYNDRPYICSQTNGLTDRHTIINTSNINVQIRTHVSIH